LYNVMNSRDASIAGSIIEQAQCISSNTLPIAFMLATTMAAQLAHGEPQTYQA